MLKSRFSVKSLHAAWNYVLQSTRREEKKTKKKKYLRNILTEKIARERRTQNARNKINVDIKESVNTHGHHGIYDLPELRGTKMHAVRAMTWICGGAQYTYENNGYTWRFFN